MQVEKRNGKKEEFDIEKLHKVIEFACEGLTGVSISEIELKAKIEFYDGIPTSKIHDTMIKSASNLISEKNPNYQYVAGKLVNYQLRKKIFDSYQPFDLYTQLSLHTKSGFYDPLLLQKYTREEIEFLDSKIDHCRDENFTFAAMEQLRGKYLLKNRVTGEIFETPQIAMMLIAMTLFMNYEKDRLNWVVDLYDAISNFDISLPTPIMAGVRTPQRQFSSCVLIETDDSLDSISATNTAIMKYVSKKAGIGIGAGRIRGFGSKIRNGDTKHTGVLPFYKSFSANVNSCSQGGIRAGSATLNVPIWHIEIEDILTFKGNRGTEDTSCRDLDYCIQLSGLFYERLINGKDITLFCPNDVPELYDSFFRSEEEFKSLYEQCERKTSIRKKKVKALELFSSLIQERKDTGRIYIMNVDHCNSHSSFISDVAPIRMTNLCCEVTLNTSPFDNIRDNDGEIALCILAAINASKIKKPSDFQKPTTLIVRALNALIDMQEYPIQMAESYTKARRPLGVGIIDFAHWKAKNGITNKNPNYQKVHEFAEAYSFYLIKASVEMAKEFGHCPKSDQTKYHYGILPIDHYKKSIDEYCEPVYKQNWDELREDLIKYGIYNSTLHACMPSESSSVVSNSTSGIDDPRAAVSVKISKDNVTKQVVPEIEKLGKKYDYLWEQEDPMNNIKLMAILQKFMDQSISLNTSYNPKFFPSEELPMSKLLGDLINSYKYGVKTHYYCNVYDGASDESEDDDCESCKI